MVPQVAKSDALPLQICLINLKMIDGVAQQYALEHKLGATNSYSLEDPELIAGFYDKSLPRCPSGGRYHAAKSLVGSPRCSIHGDTEHPVNAERAIAADIERVRAWSVAMLATLTLSGLWLGKKWPAIVGFTASALFASALALTKPTAQLPSYTGPRVQEGLLADLLVVSVFTAAAFLICTTTVRPVRLLGIALTVISGGLWLLVLTVFLQSR